MFLSLPIFINLNQCALVRDRKKKWALIYFHTLVGRFHLGPIRTMRQVFSRMTEEQQDRVVCFAAIHMGWVAKFRNSDLFSFCRDRPKQTTEILTFGSIIDYLRQKEDDP